MEIQTVTKQAYDIIVVGGGIAGISAAVSAARQGCSVLLIEKEINLGGLATIGLISWYEPLCDGAGHQMIGGIGEELIRLAVSCGYDSLPRTWGGEERFPAYRPRYASHFSPTFFAMVLDQYVLDAGVELLFDTRATYPYMEGNECRGVIVENINGREFYPAKVVIDATGNATVMSRAGVPCEDGKNYMSYVVHEFDYDSARVYAESGDLCRFRRWKNSGSDLYGNGHPQGMKYYSGVDVAEETEFIIRGKQLLLRKYEGSDRTQREIMMLPEMPQFRTIRHIVGKTVFDGLTESLDCPACIGITGDFRKSGKHYALPYSILWHSDFPNLLAAGRIISATGEGWEITRVIPVCALTGQAAGIAASLAIKNKTSVQDVAYEDLRTALEAEKVIFSFD